MGGKIGHITREGLVTELGIRRGLVRRTDLSLWMIENRTEIAAAIEQMGGTRMLNWPAFASLLNEGGIVGRGGCPISADMARKAWARVVQTKPPITVKEEVSE